MSDVVPEQPPASNRGLWMLVIGLGIAILVVVAAMIAMAIRNMIRKDAPAQAPQAQTVVLKPGEIAELNVDLDPGATIADAKLEGTSLVVRINGPDSDQIMIIEPSTSKIVSRIRFNHKATEAAVPARP